MSSGPKTMALEHLLGAEHYQAFLEAFSKNTFYRCKLNVAASEILTPKGLEDIINTRRLSFPRCRLVRSGRLLPPESYNERSHSALGEAINKLIPERVVHELGEGATLVMDFAEDLSLRIRHIAEFLSSEFHEKTGATIFFSDGQERGFTAHWDNSDTFILQLSGSKKWNLYAPDVLSPVEGNKPSMAIPEGVPSQCTTLDKNDFLYLPRGYWHAPEPCNVHSMHISFAFRKRNGIDFIQSLVPLLSAHLAFREDINKHATLEDKIQYIDNLHLELDNILTVENLDLFIKKMKQRVFVKEIIELDKFTAAKD